MKYTIAYHELVAREDLPKIDARTRDRIRRAIELRLTTNPEIYGKPLRRSLRGYRKLRVGDYRIIFKIVGAKIKVLMIGHRKMVYEKIDQRIG